MEIRIRLSQKGNLAYLKASDNETVTLPFEDYIKGVVAAEMGNASLEACKAQAVAARTFAYPSARDGKAIMDTGAHDQAFIAARMDNHKEYANAIRAVEETEGMVLTYQGQHIGKNAHYSSANNGTTKNKRYKWPSGSDVPYLVLRPDHWTYQELQLRKAAGQRIRYGHGVGMSQYGAMYAARQGVGYKDILAFYYPGCELVNIVKPVDAAAPLSQPKEQSKSQALLLTEKMAAFARSKVGGKYVFGASGPVNFDCSGLVKRIAEPLGLELYHGATTMWLRGFQNGNPKRYGYWVETGIIDTLPPGTSAVLFNQDKSETRRLVMAHTGFYDGLTGNVIQAGGWGGRGVHEDPLDKRRWTHWAILKGMKNGGSEESMTNILRRGSVGQAVRKMQTALLAQGFNLGSYGADGKFGAKTETAVMAFQRLHGLPVNGAWGADEQATLTPHQEIPAGSVEISPADMTDKQRLIWHLGQALELAKRNG